MLEFGDSIYYIDLKAFDKAITIVDNTKGKANFDKEIKQTMDENGKIIMTEMYEKILPQNKEIDAAKYDLLKTFVEYVIDYSDESDDTLGADRALSQTPLGFKIVFNTLLNEGILKEKQ
jgi:hypothetical protein